MKKDILSQIVDRKKTEVEQAMEKVPESVLCKKAEQREPGISFYEALRQPGPSGANIIAEIKRASPSRGAIRPDLDPAEYARAYQEGGAAAVSVLTDNPFFNGSLDDLSRCRRSCNLPLLRKEFIISTYQIYEAAVAGADAFLLIVRILSLEDLKRFIDLGASLGLDALVEIHSEEDLEKANLAGARLVGINNRNLASFHTDINISIRMVSNLSGEQVAVAASGISSRADVERNLTAGIFNFLVGEHLVRAENPCQAVRELCGFFEQL